jgi:hypothetical protein
MDRFMLKLLSICFFFTILQTFQGVNTLNAFGIYSLIKSLLQYRAGGSPDHSPRGTALQSLILHKNTPQKNFA